ncbi:MAG TPA: helix-turn-helix domain-containing protein [Halioglobus sp.]
MTDKAVQLDAFTTPGSLLRTAREVQGMTEREAADRLNLMPGYVAILERDDYQALRSPPFARGYVKAYGRLLGLDEQQLMAVFDQVDMAIPPNPEKRTETRPLQLQHTGFGVVIGLGALLLLVLALWWLEVGRGGQVLPSLLKEVQLRSDDALRFEGAEK